MNANQGNLRTEACAAGLRQCALFETLDRKVLADIARFSDPRQFDKGTHIFSEGDESSGFFVIQSGVIRLYRVNPVGKEQVIHLCRRGESFGEATLVGASHYPVSAQAEEASAAIFIPRSPFVELLSRHTELALHLIAGMGRRLRRLIDLVEDLKLKDSETRLLNWLHRKCEPGNATVFKLDVTKRVFASRMGISSETLSRTFARLRELGLIRVDGPRIEVLDCEALKMRLQHLLSGSHD